MNKIRLSNYPHASSSHGGVKTEVNGVELQEVGYVHLDCPVDGYPRLTVTQNAFDGLDVTLNGTVYPKVIVVDPNLELMVEQISSTQTRYWTRRKDVVSDDSLRERLKSAEQEVDELRAEIVLLQEQLANKEQR